MTSSFIENGYEALPSFFDQVACNRLLASALSTRSLDDLFLTREQFESDQQFKRTNPRPGRNLLEKLDTDFIFSSSRFDEVMKKACGDRWRVLDYKFVMGIPRKSIPAWLEEELGDRLVANLGPYVKEQYRDITYFRGIDYHQDIIDFPDRDSDFITAYIYLDKVDKNCSPLYLLENSHLLGASVFPHRLQQADQRSYQYRNDFNEETKCNIVCLTGDAGSLYYWHANTLHGTQPQVHDEPRLSVRILVEKNTKALGDCLVDQVNRQIKGRLSLQQTRQDLDVHGKAVMSGNAINKSMAD